MKTLIGKRSLWNGYISTGVPILEITLSKFKSEMTMKGNRRQSVLFQFWH